MDKFADVLKVFTEKHLIPSVISVVGALVAFYLVAEDSLILLKLGNTLFIVLTFCVCFLAIQLISQVTGAIKKAFSSMKEYAYSFKQSERSNHEAIRNVHEFVDSLSPEDKEILITFVNYGNRILLEFKRIGAIDGLLQNANIVYSSAYFGDIRGFDRKRYWITKSLEHSLLQGLQPIGELTQYKLRESVYNDLSSIHKLEGRLGNF